MIKEVAKLFGIDDIVIYPIIEDTEKEFKYDEGIRLNGTRQISLTYKLEQKEAKHSFEVCEKVKSITLNIDYTNIPKEEVAELNNKYCLIKMQILDTQKDGGDVHFYIYKALLSIKNKEIIGISEYSQHKFDGYKKLIDIKINHKPVNLIAREDKNDK